MKTNIVVDISPPIPYLAKFSFSSYEPKCCQPIKLQDFLKCNISRKKWMMKFIFGMEINIEVFYKLILSCWVCATRHAQSTQNKFASLCNLQNFTPCFSGDKYLQKSMGSWFLAAIKHESLLLVDSIILGLFSQVCPKYPKQ